MPHDADHHDDGPLEIEHGINEILMTFFFFTERVMMLMDMGMLVVILNILMILVIVNGDYD